MKQSLWTFRSAFSGVDWLENHSTVQKAYEVSFAFSAVLFHTAIN